MSDYNAMMNRLSRIRRWKDSKEYQAMCGDRYEECKRLMRTGAEYLHVIQEHKERLKYNAVKLEYATGGDIHRGFYCPSPVLDIIIGNTHRGRILKRVTSKSNISHCFGMDEAAQLIYAEVCRDKKVVNTEYLFSGKNSRVGVAVNANGEIESVSEEVFDNQKLIRYSYLSVYPDQDEYFFANLHAETYVYDVQGLKSCGTEDFQPHINNLQKYHYSFEREDGYLTTFTAIEWPEIGTDDLQGELPTYLVRMRRKA